MRIKKSPQADLNNKRSMFTLIGLVITLGFTYILFEWSKSNATEFNIDEVVIRATDDEEIDNTNQDEPEQEPEPEPEQQQQETPEVPEIVEVDNDKKTDSKVEAQDEDQKGKVEIPTQTLINDGGEEDPDDVPVVKVQKKASFPGGKEALTNFLKNNLTYPSIAADEGIEGTVIVSFVVGKTGEIRDVKVMRPVDKALDEEAIRVVKSMPKWTPAMNNDRPCASFFRLPVNFRLNK